MTLTGTPRHSMRGYARRSDVLDVIYLAATIALFALVAVIAKAAEKL